MTTYITTADVDTTLGAGWEGTGDKDRAVLEANAWMTARGVVAGDPVEDDIVMAGSLLAQEAANGRLYADSEGALKRKRVKADTVESEKEYQDGSRATSGALSLIYDLLGPFIPAGSSGNQFAVRRA